MRKTLTLKAIHSLLCMSLEAEGKSTLLKRHAHSYLSQSCHGSAMLGISFMSFLFRCVRPGHSLNRRCLNVCNAAVVSLSWLFPDSICWVISCDPFNGKRSDLS